MSRLLRYLRAWSVYEWVQFYAAISLVLAVLGTAYSISTAPPPTMRDVTAYQVKIVFEPGYAGRGGYSSRYLLVTEHGIHDLSRDNYYALVLASPSTMCLRFRNATLIGMHVGACEELS